MTVQRMDQSHQNLFITLFIYALVFQLWLESMKVNYISFACSLLKQLRVRLEWWDIIIDKMLKASFCIAPSGEGPSHVLKSDLRATTGSVCNVVIEILAVCCNKEVFWVPFSMALYVYPVFTTYVNLISFYIHSSDVGLVVALVWPPKSLRSQKVALARKRLCTTVLWYMVSSGSSQNSLLSGSLAQGALLIGVHYKKRYINADL